MYASIFFLILFVNLDNLSALRKQHTPIKLLFSSYSDITKFNMPFLELFDETLDINSTENYDLSVQVSPDGFSYCLLDTIRNKYVLIRSSEPEENKYFNASMLNDFISSDDFLTKKFKKTRIVIPSSKFTLVPSVLFDPGKKEEYFKFNHQSEENDIILSNKIGDPDTIVIFSTLKPFIEVLDSFFPGVQPVSHIKPLLRNISYVRKSISGHYIHVHVERDFFNLIVFSNNSLLLCNTFSYRNISDILYYVLNVFKSLNINQEETIYFSGITGKYDDLTSNFSIYIRHILFAVPSGNFTFSYVFNDLEVHRYLNLLTLINCE